MKLQGAFGVVNLEGLWHLRVTGSFGILAKVVILGVLQTLDFNFAVHHDRN